MRFGLLALFWHTVKKPKQTKHPLRKKIVYLCCDMRQEIREAPLRPPWCSAASAGKSKSPDGRMDHRGKILLYSLETPEGAGNVSAMPLGPAPDDCDQREPCVMTLQRFSRIDNKKTTKRLELKTTQPTNNDKRRKADRPFLQHMQMNPRVSLKAD